MNDFDEQNNEKVLEDEVGENVVEEDINSQENAENVEKTDKNNDENKKNDCFKTINDVVKEFFAFKQFKRIPIGLAVVAGIIFSPLLIASLVVLANIYLLCFFSKIIAAPADFLLQHMRKEGNNKLSNGVVYFVGYPFVFLFKMGQAIIALYLAILFFIFDILAYAYGCGGIKLSPFLFDENYDCYAGLIGNASKCTISIILTLTIIVGAFYVALIGVKIGSVVSQNSVTNEIKIDTYEKLDINEEQQKKFMFNPTESAYYVIEISSNDENLVFSIYANDALQITDSQSTIQTRYYMWGGQSVEIMIRWSDKSRVDPVAYLKITRIYG